MVNHDSDDEDCVIDLKALNVQITDDLIREADTLRSRLELAEQREERLVRRIKRLCWIMLFSAPIYLSVGFWAGAWWMR
jgi:hypothetical protein